MGDSVRFEAQLQGCRFSDPALLAGVPSVRNRGAKHPRRNCGVRFRSQCHLRLQTQRAVQGRTRLAAERTSQAGTRCVTRRAIDCRAESGVEVLADSDAEFPGLGAIDGPTEPRTRRATDCRAKSLIDGHIDGRIALGVEPRSHPRIDPPIAGSSAAQSSGSGRGLLFRGHFT
jgi:hypothetical protein